MRDDGGFVQVDTSRGEGQSGQMLVYILKVALTYFVDGLKVGLRERSQGCLHGSNQIWCCPGLPGQDFGLSTWKIGAAIF